MKVHVGALGHPPWVTTPSNFEPNVLPRSAREVNGMSYLSVADHRLVTLG